MTTNKFIIKIDPSDLVPKNSARVFYYIAFWLIVIQGAAIAALWQHIPKVIPFFFTKPWGEARLAPKLMLGLIPALALVLVTINLMMGRRTKETSPLLAYTLAVASAVIVGMFTLAVAGILQSVI